MDRTDPAVYFCGQMKNAMRNNLLVAMLLILSGQVYAQSNDIQGKVIDQKTGEPLVGVEVFHLESGETVMTDFDGNFSIRGVDPGKNSLSVSYVSYEKKELTSIDVKSGNHVNLNIKLIKVKNGTLNRPSLAIQPVFGEIT